MEQNSRRTSGIRGGWECRREVTAALGLRGGTQGLVLSGRLPALAAPGLDVTLTCCRSPRRSPFALRSGSGTAWKRKLLRPAVGRGRSNATKQPHRPRGPEGHGARYSGAFPSPGCQPTRTPWPSSLRLQALSPRWTEVSLGGTTPSGRRTHTAFRTIRKELRVSS